MSTATRSLTAAATKKLFALRKGATVKRESLIALYGEHATAVLLEKNYIAYRFGHKTPSGRSWSSRIVLWKKLPTVEKFAELLDGFRVTVAQLVDYCEHHQGNAEDNGYDSILSFFHMREDWPANFLEKKVIFFKSDSSFEALAQAVQDYAEEQKTYWAQLADEIADEGDEVDNFDPEDVDDEGQNEAA